MNERALDWTGPDLLDAAEVQRADGDLLVLDAAGGISCVDLESKTVTLLGIAGLPELPIDPDSNWIAQRWRIHASADGAFAAVVFDGGRYGFVLDLHQFQVTMQLDGGDYYEETVPFSICFFSMDGVMVLVHRTSWNRLDASDPKTGKLLTERHPLEWKNNTRPPHYLDYFHGRLCLSPSGYRLLDSGWIWHPIAAPRIFDGEIWLSSNVWESEDGASVQSLPYGDKWNVPGCWIDDNCVAMAGIGIWDGNDVVGAKVPAEIWIIDVQQAGEVPDRRWPLDAEVRELFTDGRSLFAAHEHNTSVWSVNTGDCAKVFDGFAASHHHRRRKELLEVKSRRIRIVAAE